MTKYQVPLTMVAVLALSACGITGPATKVAADAPQQWQAPLPHNGSTGELANWWQRQSDPLLVQLIEAAQAASPTIAGAQARLAAASAERTAAGAATVIGTASSGGIAPSPSAILSIAALSAATVSA